MARFETPDPQNTIRDIAGSKQNPIHPIWRGIGFVLMIVTPIMGYAASILLLDLNAQNRWIPIPRDLIIAGKDPYLLIKLFITLIIALLIFLLFQIVTFFILRISSPSRYGPTDVPPVRYTGRKYKR
ncbi:MAG: hypothetical protein BGO78_01490 [Chloroflexi bacterium 44-23]|mgnify:CR=1 FL=1|nr:MAG: hypothetical protein BGO78_01490 [Chloroflexi bacterium 44-23]